MITLAFLKKVEDSMTSGLAAMEVIDKMCPTKTYGEDVLKCERMLNSLQRKIDLEEKKSRRKRR